MSGYVNNMKIWVFGDSFSASADKQSWARLLNNSVIKANNGSSEYRIWRTYQENKHKIKKSDKVIFCHTHYSRVYLRDDKQSASRSINTHPHCDLLINDSISKNQYLNELETIWDSKYLEDSFNLLVNDLKSVPNSIHITFFDSENITSYKDIWDNFKGNINHLNTLGNKMVLDSVNKLLNPIKRIVSFGASIAEGAGLDNPETESYAALIANELNVELDNKAIGGASNIRILNTILNYEFKENDYVIIMWAPVNRDYFFEKDGSGFQMGVWESENHPDKFNSWVNSHSEYDLALRSWMQVQHATLYLNSKQIPFVSVADDYNQFTDIDPGFSAELSNSKLNVYKIFTGKSKDNLHPGAKTHVWLANRIRKLMS